MIYLYLMGGLGNQLFQYAFARGIQKSRNDKIIVITNDLNNKQNYLRYLNVEYEEK